MACGEELTKAGSKEIYETSEKSNANLTTSHEDRLSAGSAGD
jgi:hypothetical protein